MNAYEREIVINLEFIYCILEWLETSRNWESVKYSSRVFDCVEFKEFFLL